MEREHCVYLDVFGKEVAIANGYADPGKDARELFRLNGRSNTILSQEDGIWDAYYEGGDARVSDVSGKETYDDPTFLADLTKASTAAAHKVPLNVIDVVRNGVPRDVKPVDLLGKKAEPASTCYNDTRLRSYIRKFNRISLRLAAEKAEREAPGGSRNLNAN